MPEYTTELTIPVRVQEGGTPNPEPDTSTGSNWLLPVLLIGAVILATGEHKK